MSSRLSYQLLWLRGACPVDAEEGGAPPLDTVMARIGTLDEQGDHAKALQTLISALETYPDAAWDRKRYQRALQWAWGCFTELPKTERQQLIAQYTASAAGDGDWSIPPLRDLTNWLQELMPTTPLTSIRARLPLAIWHHLEGNEGHFVGYGLSIPEQARDSPGDQARRG